MASLFKRGDFYYLQFCDVGRSPRLKQIALHLRHRSDALRKKVELEDAFITGRFDPWTGECGQETLDLRRLGPAINSFLKTRENRSRYTVKKYTSVLGLLRDELGKDYPVARIRTEHVESFLKKGKKKPSTQRTYSTTLSPFFGWLARRGVIALNPVSRVRIERPPSKTPRYMTSAEVQRIVAAIRNDHRCNDKAAHGTSLWLVPIIECNVLLGLRAGEIVNLTWEDVDLETGVLYVRNGDGFTTKSRRERTIPICDQVKAVLERMDRRSVFVFPSYSGKKLGRSYLSRRFKHFARKARVSEVVNFHSTRHTACSRLVLGGASVEAARSYMGHSSITVTQVYSHINQDQLRQQVELAFTRCGNT